MTKEARVPFLRNLWSRGCSEREGVVGTATAQAADWASEEEASILWLIVKGGFALYHGSVWGNRERENAALVVSSEAKSKFSIGTYSSCSSHTPMIDHFVGLTNRCEVGWKNSFWEQDWRTQNSGIWHRCLLMAFSPLGPCDRAVSCFSSCFSEPTPRCPWLVLLRLHYQYNNSCTYWAPGISQHVLISVTCHILLLNCKPPKVFFLFLFSL